MSATSRNLTRRLALVATAATASLVLAACGGGSDSGSAGSGNGSASSSSSNAAAAHNAQDVSFAQGMIPHHQQAVQMAGLAADRASSAQVKDLAARIEKAQDPEINTMTDWLKFWGKDVPSSDSSMGSMGSMGSMPGMSQSDGSSMPGMMSSSHLTELKTMSGKEFDTMFLTMMVEHHKGAVEMASEEKGKGEYGPATSMADGIIATQNAEISEMNKMLGKG
ncbi:MAG: DUF305 domain-containing protein [Streptomyces sp.]|uniref:DUF305 domain-containing protein n=1 Tax=Streptomyces sp. TaxID=1931 RepID=UPI0025E9D717|nr:DUF305 domain-containing protein [Streptomyces sp.]MBW8801478.1 DUF305 domain-containing protein [Streptomyces sp.]